MCDKRNNQKKRFIETLTLQGTVSHAAQELFLTLQIPADQRTHSVKEWGKYQAPDEPV